MSPQAPYVPVHRAPIATADEQQRMLEKLARRAKPQVSVQISNTGETPKAELRLLEWEKPRRTGEGRAVMFSTCRTFRIDKVTTRTASDYTIWKLAAIRGELNQRLGCVDEPDKAKALCEAAR